MVVFETEDWLEPEICRLLQGDLMPVRIACNLTPEQARLYEYLQTYCNEHHMWCGNASELATFANLSYPFDPNIVWELVERRLIEHHAVQRYCLTISQVEEV